MKKDIRQKINSANAEQSTGPRTPEGKQRAKMNAFKHGLTGYNLMLQPQEHESYERTSRGLFTQYQPKTEMENQLVQRMVDSITRLNRISALENNFFSVATLSQCTDAPHDDAVEIMVAQTRAWMENADNFEKLGRYESRIARQLREHTRELERIQKERKENEAADALTEKLTQRLEESGFMRNLGSFCQPLEMDPPEPFSPDSESLSTPGFPVANAPETPLEPSAGL